VSCPGPVSPEAVTPHLLDTDDTTTVVLLTRRPDTGNKHLKTGVGLVVFPVDRSIDRDGLHGRWDEGAAAYILAMWFSHAQSS